MICLGAPSICNSCNCTWILCIFVAQHTHLTFNARLGMYWTQEVFINTFSLRVHHLLMHIFLQFLERTFTSLVFTTTLGHIIRVRQERRSIRRTNMLASIFLDIFDYFCIFVGNERLIQNVFLWLNGLIELTRTLLVLVTSAIKTALKQTMQAGLSCEHFLVNLGRTSMGVPILLVRFWGHGIQLGFLV